MAEAYENAYQTTESKKRPGLIGHDSLRSLRLAPDTKFDVAATNSTKHLPPSERIQEIERREKLAREIQEGLNSREKLVNKLLYVKYRGEKNWPLPVWKLARHNIEKDIAPKHRTRVRRMYFLWGVNVLALVWNSICYLMWSTWPNASSKRVSLSGGGAVVMLSMLYSFAGIPLSWQLWYKRYYNTYAGRVNNGRLGLRYFIHFGIHCLFAILMAIGLEGTAAAGLLAMLKCVAQDTKLGMLMLIAFVLWCIVAFASIWIIKTLHVEYGLQIAGKKMQKQWEANNNPRVIMIGKGGASG